MWTFIYISAENVKSARNANDSHEMSIISNDIRTKVSDGAGLSENNTPPVGSNYSPHQMHPATSRGEGICHSKLIAVVLVPSDKALFCLVIMMSL